MLEHILKTNSIDLVLCESPTNPGLKIIDLEAVANLSHKYNALFAVDNSLATFISQRPLDFGFYHVHLHSSEFVGLTLLFLQLLHQQLRFHDQIYI